MAKNGFGVELEISDKYLNGKQIKHKDVEEIVREILKNLKQPKPCVNADPWHVPRNSGHHWDVKHDWSVGYEVSSPILSFTKHGWDKLRRFTDQFQKKMVERFNVYPSEFMDSRGGLHFHISRNFFSRKDIETLFRVFMQYENTIYGMFPSFRRNSTHNFPMSDFHHDRRRTDSMVKYSHECVVNYHDTHPTIEIRHAPCSVDSEEIMSWVRFLMVMIRVIKKRPDFQIQFKNRHEVNREHDTIKNLTMFLTSAKLSSDWLKKSQPVIVDWAEKRHQQFAMAA